MARKEEGETFAPCTVLYVGRTTSSRVRKRKRLVPFHWNFASFVEIQRKSPAEEESLPSFLRAKCPTVGFGFGTSRICIMEKRDGEEGATRALHFPRNPSAEEGQNNFLLLTQQTHQFLLLLFSSSPLPPLSLSRF